MNTISHSTLDRVLGLLQSAASPPHVDQQKLSQGLETLRQLGPHLPYGHHIRPGLDSLLDSLRKDNSVRWEDVRVFISRFQQVRDESQKTPPPPSTRLVSPLPAGMRPVTGLPSLGNVQCSGQIYKARANQREVVVSGVKHFQTIGDGWRRTQRGIFRLDTGLGKSVTYAFLYRALREDSILGEIFRNSLIIMGCNRLEPLRGLAQQFKDVLPDVGVSLLDGRTDLKALQGVPCVVGNYQQLAQAGTISLLRAWAGRKRILFIFDEVDLIVYKGPKVDAADTVITEDKTEDPDTAWFQPLIEFGLFDEQGRYHHQTEHYMIGASATLDRPDGISLSTVWGAVNLFYHRPMTHGIQQGLLVPVLGKIVETKIPAGANPEEFKDLIRFNDDGYFTVDPARISKASETVYVVKTSVRAVLDNMLMEIGIKERKGKAIRPTIGFTATSTALEKHMRWQQDLFQLVETIFHIHQGLHARNIMTASGILNRIQTDFPQRRKMASSLKQFCETIRRFLDDDEWEDPKKLAGGKAISQLMGQAISSLSQPTSRTSEIWRALMDELYETLNVEVRKVKGRPLIASAVWDKMDENEEGHHIRIDPGRTRPYGPRFPNHQWPNLFGNREETMAAFLRGEIDCVWNIEMYSRGTNVPHIALIVDDASTHSRRELVQRVGRGARPSDGANPTDHSRKPNCLYVTVTPNLEAHKLDIGRQDLGRAFGVQMDPDTGLFRIVKGQGPEEFEWITPDPVQLHFRDAKTINLILVGEKIARAFHQSLKRASGGDIYDPSAIAYATGISHDALMGLLTASHLPSLESFIKWCTIFEKTYPDIFTPQRINELKGILIAEVAEMRALYGSAWKIYTEGDRRRIT